ncbi:MAG: DUF4272 domain-containing protein [Sulfurimonas sp.]
MNMEVIRNQTFSIVERLGYPINSNLPLLNKDMLPRDISDIVNRSLVLHAIVACSYGFDKSKAYIWIEQEGLQSYLSKAEFDFLKSKNREVQLFQSYVEDLYIFAWVLSFIESISLTSECDASLVSVFPNLKINESSAKYRNIAKLRPVEELIGMLDIFYNIHWAITDMHLSGTKPINRIGNYVFIERRRALEWVLSKVQWDEVSLDT